MPPTGPRTFRDRNAIIERRGLIELPHVAPLTAFAQSLRAEGRGTVPNFDPLDGGIDATVLFLMEKPGPMTDDAALSGRTGSGFISRDNDDPTAAAIFAFMQEAGIERRQSVIWNIVPWWNGTRKIVGEELTDGLDRLGTLLDLLPELRVVVGVGNRASRASGYVTSRGLPFLRSAHPSPINRASRPQIWASIPSHWAEARRYL